MSDEATFLIDGHEVNVSRRNGIPTLRLGYSDGSDFPAYMTREDWGRFAHKVTQAFDGWLALDESVESGA